jgi:hypothetical protein
VSVHGEVTLSLEGKGGPLVAIALSLAKRLDDPDEKSPAPVAAQLRATLDQIDVVLLTIKKDAADDPLAATKAGRADRKARASGR